MDLISWGPKPVTVRLCFGRDMPGGPTGSWRSIIGAEVLGLRSRGVAEFIVLVAIVRFGDQWQGDRKMQWIAANEPCLDEEEV